MIIHNTPFTTVFNGKKFHLAHGEGLGTKSRGYKILLSIFRNKPLQVMYSSLHPSIGVGIGHKWSLSSRLGKGITKEFLGEEKEDLVRYAKSILETDNIDYFLFGHRHLAMSWKLQLNSEIIFLGDWIKNGSYAEWNGENLTFTMLDQSLLSSTFTVSI
jgi:UDP-2,3-diacylglucosamine hydrolase